MRELRCPWILSRLHGPECDERCEAATREAREDYERKVLQELEHQFEKEDAT